MFVYLTVYHASFEDCRLFDTLLNDAVLFDNRLRIVWDVGEGSTNSKRVYVIAPVLAEPIDFVARNDIYPLALIFIFGLNTDKTILQIMSKLQMPRVESRSPQIVSTDHDRVGELENSSPFEQSVNIAKLDGWQEEFCREYPAVRPIANPLLKLGPFFD